MIPIMLLVISVILLQPVIQVGGENCTLCGKTSGGQIRCPPKKCKRFKLRQEQTRPNDWGGGNSIYLDRHTVNCKKDGLNQFQLRRPRGNQINYKYKCLDGVDAPSNTKRNTGSNDWGGGNTIYLDRHHVDCKGKPIANFRLVRPANNKLRYDYQCNNLKTTGQCRDTNSGWNQESANTIYLDRHNVQCNSDEVITKFNLVRNGKGKFRYNYKCCKM